MEGCYKRFNVYLRTGYAIVGSGSRRLDGGSNPPRSTHNITQEIMGLTGFDSDKRWNEIGSKTINDNKTIVMDYTRLSA